MLLPVPYNIQTWYTTFMSPSLTIFKPDTQHSCPCPLQYPNPIHNIHVPVPYNIQTRYTTFMSPYLKYPNPIHDIYVPVPYNIQTQYTTFMSPFSSLMSFKMNLLFKNLLDHKFAKKRLIQSCTYRKEIWSLAANKQGEKTKNYLKHAEMCNGQYVVYQIKRCISVIPI